MKRRDIDGIDGIDTESGERDGIQRGVRIERRYAAVRARVRAARVFMWMLGEGK